MQTIYYLPDIEQVMKEVYRVLQVDGEVFLSFQKQELMKEQKRSQSLSTYSEEDISCLFQRITLETSLFTIMIHTSVSKP